MKKYLKIATPAKLQADIAKKWPTVELTPELSGAKLAALVIEAGDLKQRALAESRLVISNNVRSRNRSVSVLA